MPADKRFDGRAYADILEDWMQWLLSINPDSNNNGRVVFLRGIDFAETPNEDYRLFTRVGRDKLTICHDQAVFLPVITYHIDSYNYTSDNEAQRLRRLEGIMEDGFIPVPNNALIGVDLAMGAAPAITPIVDNRDDILNYRTITRDFELVVPDSSYGRTLATLLDYPIPQAGKFDCRCGAYAYLVTQLDPGHTYTIVSAGRGEDGYNTAMTIDIEVVQCDYDRRAGVDHREQASLIQKLKDIAKKDEDFKDHELNNVITEVNECFA